MHGVSQQRSYYSKKADRDAWSDTVLRMKAKGGALSAVTDDQIEALIDYLAMTQGL